MEIWLCLPKRILILLITDALCSVFFYTQLQLQSLPGHGGGVCEFVSQEIHTLISTQSCDVSDPGWSLNLCESFNLNQFP